MIGKYSANNKPAPTVQKKPTKYILFVIPGGIWLLESMAKRREEMVRRITQLRLENVIFCFTMMAERMRLKTSWEERRRDEVETGR